MTLIYPENCTNPAKMATEDRNLAVTKEINGQYITCPGPMHVSQAQCL